MKIPQYNLDGLGAEFKITAEVEKYIARFLGVKHCVMVNSGTTAIFLALRALGAKKVAIPNLTMFGTAAAAELAGCEIVLVSNNEIPDDVDTYVHVSLNGRDSGIKEVLSTYPKLKVVEDAAQSFGSMHNDKYLGTFGEVGCFSFSPHKIISAGNGGCVVTDNDEIAKSIKKLKNFGRASGGLDQHESIGYNFKFTDIQASFMLPQLKEIDKRIKRKKDIYKAYYRRLEDVMLSHDGTPWFVDLYVEDRDGFVEYLNQKDIGVRKMYPLISEQPPFAGYETFGDIHEDEYRSKSGVWLPCSLDISDNQINEVVEVVLSWKNR